MRAARLCAINAVYEQYRVPSNHVYLRINQRNVHGAAIRGLANTNAGNITYPDVTHRTLQLCHLVASPPPALPSRLTPPFLPLPSPRHPSSILSLYIVPGFSFWHYLFIALCNIRGYSSTVSGKVNSRIIRVHKWNRSVPRVDVFAEDVLSWYWWENRSCEVYNGVEMG